MSRSFLDRFIAGAMLVLVGIVLGKLSPDFPFVKLDLTANVVDVLMLLFTVLLGTVLVRRFERGKHSDQLKKDAVLARVREAEAALGAVESLVDSVTYPEAEAIRTCRRLRQSGERLVQATEGYGYQCVGEEDRQFSQAARLIWELLTQTSRAGEMNNTLVVVTRLATLYGDEPSRAEPKRLQMDTERQSKTRREVVAAIKLLLEIERQVINRV